MDQRRRAGRKKTIMRGSGSSNPPENESELVPENDFNFPQRLSIVDHPTLAPDPDMHVSCLYNTDGKMSSTRWRCAMPSIKDFWSHLVERGEEMEHVRARILGTPFGPLISCTSIRTDRPLIFALAERWWHTTHTFHLPCGEIGITPLDFTMLTGLSVGEKKPVLFDSSIEDDFERLKTLLPSLFDVEGRLVSENMDGRYILNLYIREKFMHRLSIEYCLEHEVDALYLDPNSAEEDEFIRIFLLYFLGQVGFTTGKSGVRAGWLASLVDLDSLEDFDWGGAFMAHLYTGLDLFVQTNQMGKQCNGITWILQYWWYEYLACLNPILKEDWVKDLWPRPQGWAVFGHARLKDEVHNDLQAARIQIETKSMKSIVWSPWQGSQFENMHICQHSTLMSLKRFILQAPDIRAWFLGDRVTMQTIGYTYIPAPPPTDMRAMDVSENLIERYRVESAWPCFTDYVDVNSSLDYETYWRKVSRGSLSAGPLYRGANMDVATSQSFRRDVQFPEPASSTRTSGVYHGYTPPPSDPYDPWSYRVVSSQGMETTFHLERPVLVPDLQQFNEETDERQINQGLRASLIEHTQQYYGYLDEERKQRANAERRMAEMTNELEALRIATDIMQQNSAPNKRGRKRRGSGQSSQGSAP